MTLTNFMSSKHDQDILVEALAKAFDSSDASVGQTTQTKVADVVGLVVKCAEALEAVDADTSVADGVLEFIEQEIF